MVNTLWLYRAGCTDASPMEATQAFTPYYGQLQYFQITSCLFRGKLRVLLLDSRRFYIFISCVPMDIDFENASCKREELFHIIYWMRHPYYNYKLLLYTDYRSYCRQVDICLKYNGGMFMIIKHLYPYLFLYLHEDEAHLFLGWIHLIPWKALQRRAFCILEAHK